MDAFNITRGFSFSHQCISSSFPLRKGFSSANFLDLRLACSQPRYSWKLKASKSSKDKTELFKELQDFNSTHGLPPHKVPSLKELSCHGRQDLANIVRRWGYKAVSELLIENEQIGDAAIQESDSSDAVSVQKYSDQHPNLSLSKRLGKGNGCVRNRHANKLQDTNLSIQHYSTKCSKGVDKCSVSLLDPNATSTRDLYNGSYYLKENDQPTDAFIDINGYSCSESTEKYFVRLNTSNPIDSDINDKYIFREGNTEELALMDVRCRGVLKELHLLKRLLHLKELEMTALKHEADKEKATLYIMQEEAFKEAANARKISMEIQSCLNAANKVFTGLKHVTIEYWVQAQNVDLSGSFNGWEHPFPMKADETSEVQHCNGRRGPLLWSAELWLYPGVYEIKFIVDGIWQIDGRKEVITKENMIQNNILRVY